MTDMSRRTRNRLDRERTILDAALAEFSQSGFSGATMAGVAQRAGISKPTLYHYFPNKTELFDAMMASKRETMLLAIETPDPEGMVPQLFRFSMAYAETVMRPDMLALARLIIGEAQRFPEIGRAYQAAGPERLLAGITAYLRVQADAGRLRFDDAEMAAEDLWGLILSAPRNRALHDPEALPTPNELRRVVFNGLRVFLAGYSAQPEADLRELEQVAAR